MDLFLTKGFEDKKIKDTGYIQDKSYLRFFFTFYYNSLVKTNLQRSFQSFPAVAIKKNVKCQWHFGLSSCIFPPLPPAAWWLEEHMLSRIRPSTDWSLTACVHGRAGHLTSLSLSFSINKMHSIIHARRIALRIDYKKFSLCLYRQGGIFVPSFLPSDFQRNDLSNTAWCLGGGVNPGRLPCFGPRGVCV